MPLQHPLDERDDAADHDHDRRNHPGESVITPEVRELYRGAPEGFVAARDALTMRLRDEARDADAAEVKKLRRPTVAAWALDRLSEEEPHAIGDLLEAGADLARAQRATLSGRDPQALRDATTRRRELVARLSQAAADSLREAGRSPDPHLNDIRGTLEAASVDEDVGERLRSGTLERTVQPSAGFGDLTGLQLVSRRDDEPEGAEPERPSSRSRSRVAADEQDHGGELEAEVRRLRRDRDAAERKAAAAANAHSRLAERVASMQTRLDAARAKLRDAESSATELRMNAKRAAKTFAAAERKVREVRPSKR
ncbi:MAG: hypothetical protein ACXWYT_00880 [Actinomycetota bacterium]